MSTRNLSVGALALTTIASLTMACQSGFSVGGLSGKKPSDERGERGASGGDEEDGDPGASGDEGEGGSESAAVASDAKLMPWCKGKSTGHQQGHVEQSVRNGAEFDSFSITALALVGCDEKLDDNDRQAVQGFYKQLKKWSKLPVAELDTYLFALTQGASPIDKACKSLDLGENAHRGLGKLLECEKGDIGQKDPYYLEDDTSSAVAALAAVHECMGGPTMTGLKRAESETSFALCGAEWRVLTKALVDKELASLKAEPAARTRVRIAFRRVEATVALTEEYLAPKLKDDAALKKFYYEVPDKAFAAAYRVAKEGAEDLAAVRAFEAKFAKSSRPQVDGCYGELRQRLIGLLKRKKVKTFEKARYEMVGPIGYQISRAVEACARKDDQEKMGAVVAELISKTDDFRGPRTMIYWFLVDALKKMEGDKPTTGDELKRLRPPVPDPLGGVQGDSGLRLSQGEIKKVSKQKGGVRLEFATVVKKDEDRECWDTDKVHSVNDDGSFTYYKKCGPWKKVTRRLTEAPALIAAENAAGLAPGRTVQMYCDMVDNYRAQEYGEARPCAPVAVEAGKGKKTSLVAFLGAEL